MTTSPAQPSDTGAHRDDVRSRRDEGVADRDGGVLSAADSAALIDAGSRAAIRSLRPNPLGLYLPWGFAYLLTFGSTWLSVGPRAALPPWVSGVVSLVSFVGAATTVVITVMRGHRGVDGPSRRVSALYGWAWVLGFAAVGVSNSALSSLGVPGHVMALIWSSTALTVVGLLMLAGGVLWPGSGQYVLGVWMLATAAASVLVGFPANFLLLALAGGGGLVVLAVVARVRMGRAR